MIAASLLEEHVRGLAASGAAVLIVEPRAKAVLAISDRTYVLGGGEVRMEGTRRSCRPAPSSSSPSSAGAPSGARSGEGWSAASAGPGRPAVSRRDPPPHLAVPPDRP